MRLVSIVCLFLFPGICCAQDAKPDTKPRIIAAIPLAITAGTPSKIILRGLNLSETTSVTIEGRDLKPEILSKGKTPVPPNYDAQKVGDSVVEIMLSIPSEVPAGTLQCVATSATGSSAPYGLMLAGPDELILEKEPNDGFKTAQQIVVGKTIVGTIHEARNVDVYAWNAEQGDKVTITVRANQVGSLLDPVLTLYDGAGQIVTGSDDVDGRDPRIETVIAKPGIYYLSVQDANDSGGPHFAYLLKISK